MATLSFPFLDLVDISNFVLVAVFYLEVLLVSLLNFLLRVCIRMNIFVLMFLLNHICGNVNYRGRSQLDCKK